MKMARITPKITFVLGGARSGKSWYCEQLAAKSESRKLYVATAEALDQEMLMRVASQRARGSGEWSVIEEPIDISGVITAKKNEKSLILVDSLSLWLSNLIDAEMDIIEHSDLLIESLKATKADIILVSNEIGMGVMPENAQMRQFRDYAGILHQRVAEIADLLIMMIAGVPMMVKGQQQKA
jgi:adenosylcobinamide kinase/adenosylcobinamide-phosphate guanylyltransferase